MKAPPHHLSERVWQQTLPALRRRRARRRTIMATAATFSAVLLALALWPRFEAPADFPSVTRERLPPHPEAEPTALAVLFVDQSGASFRQLLPDEIANEGLQFELTLEPVITGRLAEFY